jgi:hypothetical protein
MFHPAPSQQLSLEGVVMGGLSVGIGGAVLALNVWLPSSGATAKKKENIGLILAAGVVVLFYLLREVFTWKQRGNYLVYRS